MNAALHFAQLLPRETVVRLVGGREPQTKGALDRTVHRLYADDLAALLNRAKRRDLDALADRLGVDTSGSVGDRRMCLWRVGAALEAGDTNSIGRPWQPAPVILSGRLVQLGPLRGMSPPANRWPRPVAEPSCRSAWLLEVVGDEPETLEDLLDRATALVGCRLGRRGRDKGAYGVAIAALLGVRELGHAEPDWRGEVEIKTVPVVRDRGGLWRVREDPAVAMEGVRPERKLGRVLWIARVADQGDSPILSWYYQEWDQVVAALARRNLHTRPKGPAGATTRGWYLHKRFFTGSGFLRSLNLAPHKPSIRCTVDRGIGSHTNTLGEETEPT